MIHAATDEFDCRILSSMEIKEENDMFYCNDSEARVHGRMSSATIVVVRPIPGQLVWEDVESGVHSEEVRDTIYDG